MPVVPAPRSPIAFADRFFHSVMGQAVLGSLLLWFAQPGSLRPIGLAHWTTGWLGWIAPAFWVGIALRPDAFTRREYRQVWFGGWVYWLLTLHWIRLPHPLTPIGWPLLCGFLAFYLVAFVLLTRVATRRTPAPVWLAAPVIWAALEFLQAHLFTGFQMGALSHSQSTYPAVIQVSDLGGGYAVSFVLMLTASAVAIGVQRSACRFQRGAAILTALAAVAGVLAYGLTQLRSAPEATGPVVALVQGASRATWDEDWQTKNQRIMDAQAALMRQADELAKKLGLRLDLAIWPESLFRPPVVSVAGKLIPPAEMPDRYADVAAGTGDWLRGLATTHDTALLLGADRYDLGPNQDDDGYFAQTIYNTAIMTDRAGKITAFYDKTHRVPFGEYIPFAKNLPALYYLTPMSGGLGEGRGPVAMTLSTTHGDYTLAPNICYESVLPHVIRRQVAQLAGQGSDPDLLVNITNDAWFWGSSELDLHLACSVFRAVENRRPIAIAANTGLSAVVDGSGRVMELSTRMQEEVIVAAVPLDGRASFYSQHGDWFALGCSLATVLLIGFAWMRKSPAAHASACSVATAAAANSN